jgi:phage-related protein
LDPLDWKPMPSVGPGVRELRVDTGQQFRVLYLARRAEAVYVLHAFEKKSRKTSLADLAIARRRYSQLMRRP